MQKNLLVNKKGIVLVEVIAAVAIAAVVITSMVSLSLYTLRSSLNAKLQLQATKVATRESEYVRAFRDSMSWEDFISSVKGCFTQCSISFDPNLNGGTFEKKSGANEEGTGVERITRYFVASNISGGQLADTDNIARITITADYVVGGVHKQTHIYTDLTNWRLE